MFSYRRREGRTLFTLTATAIGSSGRRTRKTSEASNSVRRVKIQKLASVRTFLTVSPTGKSGLPFNLAAWVYWEGKPTGVIVEPVQVL